MFELQSAVTYGGCTKGKPCCFLKTSVEGHQPMPTPPVGGSELWIVPSRNQDDEKLTFLSLTLGSHMVLQRAPQQAVVWGYTAPCAVVTTTMAASGGRDPANATFTTVAGADGTCMYAKRPCLPAHPNSCHCCTRRAAEAPGYTCVHGGL